MDLNEGMSWGPAQAFDELLLLKRGGQAIYCGPLGAQSAQLIAYFQVCMSCRSSSLRRPA